MKQNYTNNELKELLEGVDLPNADKAWEKMTDLLDSAAESGGSTTVGHSLVFKTIIWLNSIFLVLTSAVVFAMYKKDGTNIVANNTPVEQNNSVVTVHLPENPTSEPLVQESTNNSQTVVADSTGEAYPIESVTISHHRAKVERPVTLLTASEPEIVQEDEVEADEPVLASSSENTESKTLGDQSSPGVSINDERSPANDLKHFEKGVEKSAPKATKQNDSIDWVIRDHELAGQKNTAGDSSISPAIAQNGLMGTNNFYARVGVGVNSNTPVSFLLKQAQLGVGTILVLNHVHGIQVEASYNPVAIQKQQWTEEKEVSYVLYNNDITARKLNYASLTVLGKHRVRPNISLSAGIQQSFLLGIVGDVNSEIQTSPGSALVTTYENIDAYSDEERFERWNTAFVLEADYIVNKFLFSARGVFSMTDITSNNFGSTSEDRFATLNLSVGYFLGK